MMFFRRLVNSGRLPTFSASVGTALASLPLMVWVNDSFFSLCRVRGVSMEPTLFDGDILVVRKSDGIWQRWTRAFDDASSEEDAKTKGNKKWAVERDRTLAYEREHCNSNGSIGLLKKPPIPIAGDVVVYKDPEKYPDRWNIKRATGFGGQIVHNHLDDQRDKESMVVWERSNGEDENHVFVPAYSIWVEGDNQENSIDSRTPNHGPVSKKLLVGIAEYRVWPPWRVGKLDNDRESSRVASK